LTGVSLDSVGRSFSAAKKARMLVRQNLSWALLYNLSVLPLAVSGALQPWMAALGMSASSLLVVLNATRMRKEAEPQPGFKPASTAVPVRP
jgi:Cu2+-exporting ATPase